MKCEYCDNEIPQGSTRCPSCGAAVKAAPAPAAPVAAAAPAPTVAAPVVVNLQQPPTPPKSRVAYVLLALFLGGLGVHNFYAGFSGRGVAQLLITILTCGWGGIISGFWALIEACVVTADSNGVRFS